MRYRAWYLGGLACLWLTNWLAVHIPLTLGRGTDALRAEDEQGVLHAALLIAAMGAAVIGVRTLSRALIFTPGRNLENDLRNDILAHVLRLRKVELEGHGAGDLVSRASNDISLVRALVGYGTLQVFNITMALVLTGRAMLDLSPLLTVACLAPVAAATLLSSGSIRTLFPLTRAMQRQLSDLSDFVLSSLQGVATVQAYGAEQAFSDRMDGYNRTYMGTVLRVAHLAALVQPVLAFSAAIALFLLLWLGAGLVDRGEVSIGDLVALSAFLLFLLPYLRSLGWLVAIVQRGRASLDRIFEILDLPLPPEGPAEASAGLEPGPLGFEIHDLSFAWPGGDGRPAIRELSARIPPGSMVGIFGLTGAGKSTLLGLLSRQHDAPPGTILVEDSRGNRVEIEGLPLAALRSRITVVPQLPFLFTSTIAENISMAVGPSASRTAQAAREAALASDLERLPDGLETVVGERGVTLSGGQRQRVALARGFARDFDLLLLDDVLSAVDHDTEQRLIQAILHRATGVDGPRPTVVIVSHRMGVLSHADQVLVLQEGRLIDRGPHRELVQRPGPYRDAWALQQDGEEPS
jgi:ATP-binding cassette subfamily B multidrug efflux pump